MNEKQTARPATQLSELVIRPIGTDDREAWERLWKGYLDFYER
jgi:hypothetical protein